jgi:hypothetical protein
LASLPIQYHQAARHGTINDFSGTLLLSEYSRRG